MSANARLAVWVVASLTALTGSIIAASLRAPQPVQFGLGILVVVCAIAAGGALRQIRLNRQSVSPDA